MALPANAMASFSNRINNRCQNNLALAFQTFFHTLSLSITLPPAPGRHKIFLFSIFAEEKVYRRVFLLPTYVVYIPTGRLRQQYVPEILLFSLLCTHLLFSQPLFHIRYCFALKHTTTIVIPLLINKRRFLLCVQEPHSANSVTSYLTSCKNHQGNSVQLMAPSVLQNYQPSEYL